MYVTHDQTEAMTMGDRIAILDGGKLQQVATPLECYHEPANQFVAGFIGEPSMNFLEMRVEGDRLVSDVVEYPLGPEIAGALGDADEVVLGIRPEAVELVDEPSGDHDFPAVVDVVEPMGNENTVYLTFEGSDETFVATIDGMRRISEGDAIVARVREDVIHVFDGATGDALHNRRITDEERAGVAPD
jgi:multiple sugar transport system ATP-binding protein